MRYDAVNRPTAHFVKIDAHDTALLSTRLWRLIGTPQVYRLVGGAVLYNTLLRCGLGLHPLHHGPNSRATGVQEGRHKQTVLCYYCDVIQLRPAPVL